ncbi:HAD family hydrolase [Vitiosangium sp. GDMCC 1.1324]|uniref:HAD family hydrolase n=1 Tax=Vitiosangium sp. (strain GDMCC 1.1324) TaxID=2138576 RepID=UPI000D36FA5B|nr:HAD-IA family hydrolase [Vitiosangium sp. GDMCC 1.1324]PTL78257.1 HAD family phosphatase [Vitiosangium sp. GDMCC 1.1324]
MTGAVIFDRDGVLAEFDLDRTRQELGPLLPFGLEQLGGHLRSWAARGQAVTDAASERAFWDAFWVNLCGELGLGEEVRSQLLRFNPRQTLRAFPDARPALEQARRRGYRVGVLSNFTLLDLPGSLEALGLGELVDAALSAAMIGTAKPAPEAYQAITRALGVAPEACLFIDDRPECVEGARRVGMRAWLLDRRGKNTGEGLLRGLGELFAA